MTHLSRHHITRRVSRRSSAVAVVAWCAVVLGAAAASHADSVKLDRLWIDGVTAQGIEGGRFIYLTPGGDETDRALSSVRGLKVDGFPGMADAETALEADDIAAAVEAYDGVLRQRPPQWLRHWIIAREIALLDSAGRPADAVARYLTLVKEEAEGDYLDAAPLKSLAGATDAQKKDLAARIVPVLDATSDAAARALLEQMYELVKVADEPAAVDPGTDEANDAQPPVDNGDTAPPRTIPPVGVEPAAPGNLVVKVGDAQIVLTNALDDEARLDDPITQMLKAGQFAQARDEAAKELQIVGQRNLAMRLYQHGLAIMGLAEQAGGDKKLYLTAAVSFMRSAVYFDRSVWKAPSLIEVAYVHMKIGRPDIAEAMLEKVQNEIDETDPALFERFQKIRTENKPLLDEWNKH